MVVPPTGLRERELHVWFVERARYHADAPATGRYSISIGSRKLFDADTHTLWDKFRTWYFDAGRTANKPKE